MSGGYTGKILNVNLKNKKFFVEKTNIQDAQDFIGAKGLGAKLLFDRLPRKTDPLSPENILMFTTGPLTGTSAQRHCRYEISSNWSFFRFSFWWCFCL